MATPALLALLIQVAAGDTARAPGTLLRLGWPVERVEALGALTPSRSPDARDAEVYQGDLRVFGLPGKAALTFEDGRLARARFKLRPASERTRNYVEDELRRMGYGARCTRRQLGWSECTWSGRVLLDLTMRGDSLILDYRPRPVPSGPGDPAPGMRPTAAAVETLGTPERPRADARVIRAWAPTLPDEARSAGVFGRVRVAALVDTGGEVIDARIIRGIRELDAAALDGAKRYRFEPVRVQDRAVRAWTWIWIVFTP